MGDRRKDQAERMARYAHLIEQQTGKAVRPFRADGYVNLLNRYGTQQDTTERYRYQAEPMVPDELLTMYYEGNGLFAKIIDTPAEEAIKHGFKLEGLKDQKVEDFFSEALDELDWEETAMTAIRWARLFGGAIAVMLINDGRGLEEPLDWRSIRSIDDIRVYDRSVIQPEEWSMFSYDPQDPFRTRGSRLGMPERYHIGSRYGSFVVHDSRCLVFQNGILPENTTSSVYQLWGIPEYIRIQRAIRDAEIAHGSATKLLDRSVQAVYKMKDLAAELATEEGEDRVLRRLQTIDMARGLLNSITIDSEGEDYDFRQFQFSGVSDVIDSTCNFLSALTSIPQTILFGRSPAGMNATGDADLENWYNALERIQKRMVKKNLRYLLSVVFQAGVHTGEIDEVPKIKITFNPLWSLSDMEQADLEQKRAQTQLTRAQTAQTYIDKQVIDPSEVRKKLADSEEFDVENMLDEYEDEDLFAEMQGQMGDDVLPGANSQGMGQWSAHAQQVTEPGTVPQSEVGSIMEQGALAEYGRGVSIAEHDRDLGNKGEAPLAAPAATKLPQDMSEEERSKVKQRGDGGPGSGNWGHTGRPGKIGGSASGTGGVQHRTGTKESGFSSKAKERAKAKASGGSSGGSSGGGAMGTGKGVDTIQAVTAKLPKAVIEEPGDKTRKISKPFLEKIGYGRKPSVLSDDEFKAAESDYPVQYRGINSPDAYERVVGDKFFVGSGANGSGANTTADRATAEHFAGENGGVVEIKLDKSAKVISDTELMGRIGDFRRSEPADGVDKTAFYHLTSDPGCIAASLGYDAIYDSSTGWLNIINRGKMIVRKQGGEASETGNLRKGEIKADEDNIPGPAPINAKPDGITHHFLNADGGPGSGNFGHKGRPGEVGGSLGEIGELAQQSANPQEYIRKNVKVLKEHGIKTRKDAVKAWKDGNYAKDIQAHEISAEEAVETIREGVPSNILTGWFRDADSTYKGRLEEVALADDAVRNAGLNIAYQNYKDFSGSKDISFDEFLDTDIPVYRGKNSENWVEGDDIVSFSFDRKVAEKFGSNVTEIKIKPGQTIGSYQTTGECEILVRRCDVDAPGFQGDSAEASETGNLRKDEIARIKEQFITGDDSGDVDSSVGVLVISDGKILTGTRNNDFGYGLICGPGGHIEPGETPAQAAFRETEEEFGISPKDLIPLGRGPEEPATGLEPYLFLCTEYEGEPDCVDLEMTGAAFRTMEELDQLSASMFQPFADSIDLLLAALAGGAGNQNLIQNPIDNGGYSSTMNNTEQTARKDGGPGSGNFGHKGVPGQVGGSAPNGPKEELEEAIATGRVSTKLDRKKQSKHTKGTAAYNKAIKAGKKVSVVTLSDDEVQGLVSRYSGKGHIRITEGQIRETFEHTSPIGFYVSRTGEASETTRGTIHYSKSGTHLVPSLPTGKGRKNEHRANSGNHGR